MRPFERSKKPVGKPDWHKADVVAALHKRGTSFRRLSIEHGYHPGVLHHALHLPYPKAERLIAKAIGVPAHVIWPSRYDADGQPLRQRGQRQANGQGRHLTAYRGARVRGNVQPKGAD